MASADTKAFIVTGSSTGVGAATALQLARRGASVVINYSKSAAEAEETAQACTKAGGTAIAVRADVAKDEDCRKLAEAAVAKWGRIDGLVNNAGTTKFASMRDLAALSAEDFQRIYAVNVIAAYQTIRACEPQLRSSRGAVVNVSSIAAYDELRGAIGREVALSDWVPVTQAQIDGFAAVTGAGEAPGLFLLSLWPRIGYGLLSLPEAAFSVNYGLESAHFFEPVRAGHRVRVRLAPSAVADVPGGVQI